MIKKVRRKFTVIAMIAMTFCTILLIGTINLVNYRQVDKRLTSVISELVSVRVERDAQEGVGSGNGNGIGNGNRQDEAPPENGMMNLPKPKMGRHSANAQYGNRFFCATQKEDGTWDAFVKDTDALTEEQAVSLAEKVMEERKDSGYLDDYKFLVFQTEKEKGVYFLDCSTDLSTIRSLLLTSLIVGFLGLIVVFLFVFYMSGKAILPLQESIARQKQFITDAGHELKTPVSVIGTNMEILKMDVGSENEWIESTKRQVTTLRKLIAHLISLSKLEENTQEVRRVPVSISDAVADCVEVYEVMAETEGKTLKVSIEPDIMIKAEENSLRQMLTVLFENAVKYSAENSEIEILLQKEGKKAVFQTKNQWNHDVKKEELDKMFERFFRGDKSRNRDGKNSGYGLGLSIAMAAAEKNKGELTVYEEGDRLVFQAKFGITGRGCPPSRL